MTRNVIVSVDYAADAAYVQLSASDIVCSKQVSADVLVDLDRYNVVVGVEMLNIDAEIPFQKLIEEFHVHSSVIEQLRSLRPSIGGRLQSMAEGSTSTAPSRGFVAA